MKVDDPTLVGDAIEVRLYEGDSEVLKATVNTFEQELSFQGSVYPEGSTLVVLQEGLGYDRNTADFARFLAIAQSALSSADPGVWGAYTAVEQLDYSYDPYARGTNVLMMPTAGDNNVPASTGVAMGRVSGLFGSWLRDETLPAEYGWREMFVPDERYGHSIDDELVASYVVEGDAFLQRFEDNPVNQSVIYDIDDVSDGTAEFSCGDSDWSAVIGENLCPEDLEGQEVFFPVPHPEPEMPFDRTSSAKTVSTMRSGSHCFVLPVSTGSTMRSLSVNLIRCVHGELYCAISWRSGSKCRAHVGL